jgi:RNA polymerase sigma-70 factor (sigma-E family)
MSMQLPLAGVLDFEAAFPALYDRAYKVAYRVLGNRSEAEEVAQEALARAYERWPKLAREALPVGWVVRVSVNLAIDTWRKRSRRGDLPDLEVASEDPSATDRVALVRGLQALSRRQREAVVLRYLADLHENDVAATLGVGVGSVKQHASRGLARLRAELGQEGK